MKVDKASAFYLGGKSERDFLLKQTIIAFCKVS